MEIYGMQKNMIVAGGYNIYPREIDEVLFDHPKVLEACAVEGNNIMGMGQRQAYCCFRR